MSIAASLEDRKWSGLGIDFSASNRSPSEASKLWEDHGIYAIHSAAPSLMQPSPIQPKRKMSRWSESTRESQQPSLACRSEFTQGSPSRQGSRISSSVGQVPTMHISEAAQEQFMRGRGSDDSQASYGPPTPTDELAVPPIEIGLSEEERLYAAPRKAPSPPPGSINGSPVLAKLPERPPGQRRGSVTQSMMRTLTGKKREGIIPPPLDLVPAVPAIPAHIDLAPNIHYIDLPIAASTSKLPSSARNSPIPAMHIVERRVSDQIRRDSGSGSKMPRASVGSLFRSIRKSMSSESRKSSTTSISGPVHLGLPVTTASPITRQQTPRSPRVPSPLLREARSKPGKASKSYDFGFSTSRKTSGGGGQRSPVVPRPMTAPANKTAFSANVQYPLPLRAAASPSTETLDSPVPQLSIRFPAESGNIEYNNPWGAYQPAASFVSSIPVSPGQPEFASEPDNASDKYDSQSEASLYKQSVLSGLEQEYCRPPESRRRSELESAIPIRRSSVAVKPTNTLRQAVPSYLPALDLPDNRISLLSVDSLASMLLSPNSEEPPPRKNSRNRSVDQAAEKLISPHLYLETLGATSLRNPFAVTGSTEGEVKRGSKPARRGSVGDKCRADETSLEEATIAFPHIRKRSSGAEEMANMPQRVVLPGKGVVRLPKPIPAQSAAYIHTSEPNSTQPAQNTTTVSSPVVETPGIDLMLSPIPTFRNPFFAKLDPAAPPNVTFASPRSGGARQPSARGVSVDDQLSFLQGRPSFPVVRNASAGETSLRRPSYASYASSSNGQFPTRPNQLETRRMTDFSNPRGIRVSLDTDIF